MLLFYEYHYFMFIRYLKFLNLSHNSIKQINNSLPHNLVEIDLSYNDLEHIQLDMSSSMCEVFNVSHNKIKLLNFLKVSHKLAFNAFLIKFKKNKFKTT